MSNTLEMLRKLETPVPFTRHFVRETMPWENHSEVLLGTLEREKLDRIIEVLEHPELQHLIEEGHITFAAIKPNVHESKLRYQGVFSDDEAASIIKERIHPPLDPKFNISVSLTPQDLEEFYPHVKLMLERIPFRKKTEWDSFVEYMTSGPLTYMLLYSEHGHDAVDEWRKQMGSTHPDRAAAGSIRGDFALSISKNLVHGSSGFDRTEKVVNVKKESGWLLKKIQHLREKAGPRFEDPEFSEETLAVLGYLKPGETLIFAKRTPHRKKPGRKYPLYETELWVKRGGSIYQRNI